MIQEDLLDNDGDGPFYSFANAPIEKLCIILDSGQILFSEGQQLDGQVLYRDAVVVYRIVTVDIVCGVVAVRVVVIIVDGNRSIYLFCCVRLLVSRKI